MTGTTSFATIVLDAFETMMSRHGYSVGERDGTGVRLDGPKSRIDISYDNKRSYEVGIEFAEVAGKPRPLVHFCLGSVFRECNVPNAEATSHFQFTDLDAMRIFLEKSAGTLMTFCDSVLQGDQEIFRALARRRRKEAASYTLQIQMQSVRPRGAGMEGKALQRVRSTTFRIS